MKGQKNIWIDLTQMFVTNRVHPSRLSFSKKDDRFEICSDKVYIMEELDGLAKYCREHGLWYYVFSKSDLILIEIKKK